MFLSPHRLGPAGDRWRCTAAPWPLHDARWVSVWPRCRWRLPCFCRSRPRLRRSRARAAPRGRPPCSRPLMRACTRHGGDDSRHKGLRVRLQQGHPLPAHPCATDCDDDMLGPDAIRLGRALRRLHAPLLQRGPDKDWVYVRDLVTGELLVQTSASETLTLGIGSLIVTDMELKANGSVAWIVQIAAQRRRRGAGGGAQVRPHDLQGTADDLQAARRRRPDRVALAHPRGLHALLDQRRRREDRPPEITALRRRG